MEREHSSSEQQAQQFHRSSDGLEPADLVLQAYEALNMGILVVSHEGVIRYYNTAYAQLRNITLDEMIGRPVETLDRRGTIRAFLHSGVLPLEESPDFNLRRNQETFVPIQDEKQLLGCVVSVTPAAERLPTLTPGARRRTPGKASGKTPWTAQYSAADIIGNSPAVVQARELALQAAQSGSSVLLLGESGTGKELFAHAIHMASPRQDCPFVPVDCSAISRELLEAELFGYAPGAFTGATKEGKPGKFELADRGTIFLDEVGEMPLEMQSKLLRVLQERRIIRVGGISPIPVDFRVIAATNRDLEQMVTQNRFRHDLLYRLDVIRIEIPSLRERPDDIPLLVGQLWRQKSRELGTSSTLSPKALQVLARYAWPGNIRELLNLIERLLVSVRKDVIEPHDLPLSLKSESAEAPRNIPPLYLKTAVAEAERQTLEKALRHTQGNRNMAAELVGLSRASFYRKLKEYGLTQDAREQELLHDVL